MRALGGPDFLESSLGHETDRLSRDEGLEIGSALAITGMDCIGGSHPGPQAARRGTTNRRSIPFDQSHLTPPCPFQVYARPTKLGHVSVWIFQVFCFHQLLPTLHGTKKKNHANLNVYLKSYIEIPEEGSRGTCPRMVLSPLTTMSAPMWHLLPQKGSGYLKFMSLNKIPPSHVTFWHFLGLHWAAS